MSLEVIETSISMSEIKSAVLRLLKEDEEFRLAVAGLLGLTTILEELKKLREDFNEFVKMQEERWQEAFKRFSRLELELRAMAESMYSKYFWDDLREELRSSGETVLEKSRNAVIDGVEVDMLIVTDRSVYVVEVKVKPDIGDVGALLAKAEVISSKLGKPAVPVLAGALIGDEVRAYAKSKGVKVHSY